MAHLRSVSESLSTFITLNICTDITEISSDLSDANVLKIPLNRFLFFCFNTSL
uniref:Uncharacterized protein n=1 Tax=Cyprinus carpio TaxID=7962 RepID=A0A8C1LFH4_CYPCA